MAVWNNKYTAVKSGNSVGKSHVVARLVLLFLIAFPDSYVITTATTFTQLDKILWSEISRQYNSCAYPIGGDLLSMELRFAPQWRAFGISPREAVNVQGYHRPKVLIIMDEAGGVRDELNESFKSLMTPGGAKQLKIGNPTVPSGHFHESFTKHAELYKRITISAFDSPNVKEGRDVIPGLVTSEWIEERRIDWGEGTPLWQAFVLGEFPEQDADALISLLLVRNGIDNIRLPAGGPTAIGCDVARSDRGDETTIALYKDSSIKILDAYQGKDTMKTAGLLLNYSKLYKCKVGIDDIGIGGTLGDRAAEMGVQMIRFIAGTTARNRQRYADVTAEAWYMIRDSLQQEMLNLPDDPKLIAQLTGRRSILKSTGQLALESKADMKARGLKSPDRADAAAIAIWTAQDQRQYNFNPAPQIHDGWKTNTEIKNAATHI